MKKCSSEMHQFELADPVYSLKFMSKKLSGHNRYLLKVDVF